MRALKADGWIAAAALEGELRLPIPVKSNCDL
jgi:hypothetical protein